MKQTITHSDYVSVGKRDDYIVHKAVLCIHFLSTAMTSHPTLCEVTGSRLLTQALMESTPGSTLSLQQGAHSSSLMCPSGSGYGPLPEGEEEEVGSEVHFCQ